MVCNWTDGNIAHMDQAIIISNCLTHSHLSCSVSSSPRSSVAPSSCENEGPVVTIHWVAGGAGGGGGDGGGEGGGGGGVGGLKSNGVKNCISSELSQTFVIIQVLFWQSVTKVSIIDTNDQIWHSLTKISHLPPLWPSVTKLTADSSIASASLQRTD